MLHKKINDILILELIGKGAFSEVYNGVIQNQDNKQVAVKVIKKTHANLKAIEDEIRILRKISHPNIVNFINHYSTKNNTYIITELCSRGTFKHFLQNNYEKGVVTDSHAKKYFRQICLGVRELHHKNIVHRDLKQDNIFINSAYMLKIGDFGFAKVTGDSAMLSSFKGTPVNMAPEIFKTNKNMTDYYDKKCDIWSLGTILYEMVYGRIIGNNIKNMKDLQAFLLDDEDIIFPNDKSVSDECKDLLAAMLRKKPENRPTIDDILAYSWLANVEDNSLNASLLIRSFYMIGNSDIIKEIDQNLFDKEGLRKFICLQYKINLKGSLKELCDAVANQVSLIDQIKQKLNENPWEGFKSEELEFCLDRKIVLMIEKLSNLGTSLIKDQKTFRKFVCTTIDRNLKKYKVTETYKVVKNQLGEVYDDATAVQDEVIYNMHNQFFNLSEKLLQTENLLDEDSSDERTAVEELEKAVLMLIEVMAFDFLSISYEIKYHKEIKKVDFDVYDINNFIDSINDVDEDDFPDSKYAKFEELFTLTTSVDYLKEYPNPQIGKAIELFRDLLKKKLERY